MDVKFHNTLTGKKEKFEPINENTIGVYSCGPTVYWNQHIGHMYAYVHWDVLIKSLKHFGYKTKWVMNITDVGHLTGDNDGDTDSGEDKMQKGAEREGLSVWQIAEKYILQFEKSLESLNIDRPDILCRATEHIEDQINLIKKIEQNGFAYQTQTGLVFDTSKFSDYDKFAHLDLEKQRSGARVEIDNEKKKPWDFLLWITNQPNHIMKWESPWGTGFPGWHIECTAMSTKYLGEKFDIHTGGKEHIPIHHTNEIAQGFGAFGHQTANYWLHNEWMTFENQKISKSLGNSILVSDIEAKNFDPLSLRYLIMTTHYKTGLNFTWESLSSAENTYKKLKNHIYEFKKEIESDISLEIEKEKSEEYTNEFNASLADDLNVAKALGIVWQIIRSKELNSKTKYKLILDFDKILSLNLDQVSESYYELNESSIPKEILELKKERDDARTQKNWQRSDELRKKIENNGYSIKDTPEGSVLEKI